MNKTKTTRQALVSSVIALALCFAMLLGTTYAWFTDSVSSTGNKIIAGTLDLDLFQVDGSGEHEITETSAPIFGSDTSAVAQNDNTDTLWEPGKTQLAYLKLQNNGSLYLKYTVKLVVTNVANNLYKAMEYTVVPDAQYDTLGASSWTAIKTANGSVAMASALADLAISATAPISTAAVNVPMAPGAAHYFALAIHMNEDAGNEYQAGEVDFDIQVLATQYTAEDDSFDNQYDANADGTPDNADWGNIPQMTTVKTTVEADAPTVLTANVAPTAAAESTKVTFEANALDSNDNVQLNVSTADTAIASATSYEVLSEGSTAVGAIDLSLYVNDSPATTTTGFGNVVVETYVATGLSGVTIQYNGAAGTFSSAVAATVVADDTPAATLGTVNYNPTTGYLSFVTDHFSEYLIQSTSVAYSSTTNSAYETIAEAIEATAAGDTVILINDVTADTYAANNTSFFVTIDKDITIDGKGHKIQSNAGRTIAISSSDVNVVLKNLTSINSATFSGGYPRGLQINSNVTNVKVTVDNCYVSSKYYAFNFCSGTIVDVTIKNSTFTGWAALNIWSMGVSVTAENSTFDANTISANEMFGAIVLEADTTEREDLASSNMTVALTGCTIKATGSYYQSAVQFNGSGRSSASGNVVALTDCNIVCDTAIGSADEEGLIPAYLISYDKGINNTLEINNCTLNGAAFATESIWSDKGLVAYAN